MTTWYALIRMARERAGSTQSALADRLGVAEKTIRNHESGRVTPARERLIQLTGALGLNTEMTNEILVAAGFSPEPTGSLAHFRAHRAPALTLQRAVSSYRWPCYVLNERQEIICWNEAVNRVAELDFASLSAPRARNLLRIAATSHFRERVLNWNHVVGPSMAFLKLDGVDLENDDPGSQYFRTVVADIVAQEDLAALNALHALWVATPPYEEGGRLTFSPQWRVSDGTVLRFNTVQAAWDEFDGVWASDWQPADATTWEWLGQQPMQADGITSADSAFIEAPQEESWSELLAHARAASALSQQALAEAAGVSEETVSSYERGVRRPRRETLLRLIRAMELDGATANVILTMLRMEPEPSEWGLFVAGLPRRTQATRFQRERTPPQEVTRVQRDINVHPWPCFILNERCEIVCWNDAATRVLGMDFQRHLSDPRQRNFLRFVVSRFMRERLVNWRDVVTVVLPNTLEQALSTQPAARDRAPAWLREAVADIERDDTGVVRQLRELWRATAPTTLSSRVVVPLIWQVTGQPEILFSCIIARWNSFDAYWAVDLHPANAATWRWIEGR